MTPTPDFLHMHPAKLAAEATSLWHQVHGRFAVGQWVYAVVPYQVVDGPMQYRVSGPQRVVNTSAEMVVCWNCPGTVFHAVGDVFETREEAEAEVERRKEQ